MPRIYARISEQQENKLKKLAEKNNFRKPSGELNVSQVIRWLIDKELLVGWEERREEMADKMNIK